jgi:hypothetical protein
MLSILLCCIIPLTVVAQNVPESLNGGLPIETGTIEDPVIMENGQGDLFFFYIKNGELLAQKSVDGGDSFTPCDIDLSYHDFSSVRDLTLYNRFDDEWLVFFIGVENGNEGIYAVGFDEYGDIRLTHYDRLDDGRAGEIENYRVINNEYRGFLITYIKDGVLGYFFAEPFSDQIHRNSITDTWNRVKEYELVTTFTGDDMTYTGTFIVNENGSEKLYSFQIVNGIVSEKTLLLESETESIRDVKLYIDENERFLMGIQGLKLFRIRKTAGIWQMPEYYNIGYDDFTYLVIPNEVDYSVLIRNGLASGRNIYFDSGNVIPSVDIENKLNTGPVVGTPGVFWTYSDGLILYYFEQTETGVHPVFRLFDFENKTWSANLELLPDAGECEVEILSSHTTRWVTDPVIINLVNRDDSSILGIYLFNGETGKYETIGEFELGPGAIIAEYDETIIKKRFSDWRTTGFVIRDEQVRCFVEMIAGRVHDSESGVLSGLQYTVYFVRLCGNEVCLSRLSNREDM